MTDLWTLQVYLNGRQQPLVLVFPAQSGAQDAYERLREACMTTDGSKAAKVADDYGTTVYVPGVDMIEALLLQDCGRASEGGIELGLQQARNQARAQERAGRDPVLKAAAQRQTLVQAQPGFPLMPQGKM